ncbi:uncharacterized protein LOC129794082 [Lutzomyia longipalpis]|uniref:uncharacterized protein LOC129794082 n=1 Tax=Lutzomyia longipalpis TaxID=7200 RepID=UPI002484050A|nr:uncharacterized protein LOC129794082 [Lutzomyia longipalpis]
MGEEMVSSISQESVVLSDTRTQQARSTGQAYAIPAHYSNTYSMSKSCSTATDDTDNVIYTDINDLYGNVRKYGVKSPVAGNSVSQFKGGATVSTTSVNRADDLYATVNRKTKTINRINAAAVAAAEAAAAAEKKRKSDEFLGDTSRGYANVSHLTNGQVDLYAKRYEDSGYTDQQGSGGGYATKKEQAYVEGQSQTLPRNGEKIETVQTYDYSARHSLGNIRPNYELYLATKTIDSDVEGSVLGKKNSSERLEYELSSANIYSTLQYKMFDGGDTGKDSWLKSASCKELYDCNFEESGEVKRKAGDFTYINAFDREFLSSDRIDSPITRYDEANRSLYVNKNHSVDVNGDFPILESKVYSSSYPGSTYNTVDHANRRGQYYQHQFDFHGSHDDVSHDSYELLEKSDDELYARIKHDHSEPHSRSCSLDSGNYILTDDESVSESAFLKYRTGDMKSRSEADIMDDLFLNEDPRDLPREKLCVKSDGSFYNKIKHQIGSRTSSQESRSDYYESKISKSSDSSKKSKDSVYHTDSKKSRETLKSKHSDRSDYNSRASSQESKESFGEGLLKNYEMPTTTGKKIKSLGKLVAKQYERNSSQESKSDYYDAKMSLPSLERSSVDGSEDVDSDRGGYSKIKVKSHDSLLTEMKSSNFYNSQSNYSTFPSNKTHKTSHVHSISLQNVEIERNARSFSYRSNENTPNRHSESQATQTQNLWSKAVEDESDDFDKEGSSFDREFRRKSDSDNIFSFDKDRIESLTQSSMESTTAVPEVNKKSPDYPLTPELMSEFDKLKIDSPHVINVKSTRKEELMAKTHFEEYNPKMILDSVSHGSGSSNPLSYIHPTVERTKSDPNSLANRSRLGSNSRRHVLMHQKSIDLTPADSSDEEYFYKQIPSAPPLCQTHRSHFEIPKSYDVPVAASDIPKSGFEMPSSFFKEYEKRCGKAVKEDIPYVLHKRHIMNGTAPSPNEGKFPKHQKPKSPKSPKSPRSPKSPKTMDGKDLTKERKHDLLSADILPDLLDNIETDTGKGFLFTQNIDLSKVDPVTLEVDKTAAVIQLSSPKRDITKKLDPKMLEALNSKLSQIESDSGSTESFAREAKALKIGEVKLPELFYQVEPPTPTKKEISIAKRLLKPRVAPKAGKPYGKGKNKAKIRITSFSSDDESLDSDDVFGSTEATPTKLEFSPPQSRKEIEPILRIEQDRLINAWGRGQTMSSTEIEGSPPQQRRLADLESRYHTNASVDPPYTNQSELRRISERSISIPSSEEEGTITRRAETTQIYHMTETIPSPILESCEFLRTDDEVYETCKEDRENDDDLAYTLITKKDFAKADAKQRTKLIEELIDSSIVMRSKGHAPILFAHARLNLSEGSAFASLQRQKATQDSPDSGRRAKSLDTPVISLHRLPPMNAFSSKDDTVGFEEEAEILEEKSLSREPTIREDEDLAESVHSCVDSLPSAKSRPKTSQGNFDILKKILIDEEERELLNRLRYIEKIALQGVKIKEKRKSKLKLKSGDHLILDIPKYRFDPFSSGNSSRKTSPGVSRASSVESTGKAKKKPDSLALKPTGTTPKKAATKSRSVETSRTRVSGFLTNQKSLPDIKKSGSKEKLLAPHEDGVKRARSQESVKRNNSKEKPRRLSKDKSRSQEENEIDIAKRKERQQKLYESAMKQTINLLSPVKDSLPPFPAPEDKISVKTEGDKIIIETEIRSKAEDHVFIAKSPKKLDTSLVKFSRSFDDTCKTTEKLDKANRSFEDRNKSMEEASDKSDIGEDFILKSPRKIMRSQELKRQIEGSVVHKKFEGKSKSLEKRSEQIHQYLDIETKTRSLDKNFELHGPMQDVDASKQKVVQVDVHRGSRVDSSDSDRKRKSTDSSESKSTTTTSSTSKSWTSLDDSRISRGKQDRNGERRSLSQTDQLAEEVDMQAIISERRNLDLLKRQSLPSEDAKDSEDKSPGPLSKGNSEESLTSVSDLKPPIDVRSNLPHRVPTIECEEPSIEEDAEDEKTLKPEKESTLLKLSLERSRSDETASWKTIECEEYVGSIGTDASDASKASTLKGDPSLHMQNTLEDAKDSNFLEPDDFDMNIIVTPPDSSPLVEKMPLPGTPMDEKKSELSRKRSDMLRITVERSRSSDTGSSWTSGEKDTSPVRGKGSDKGSMDEESSVSCSISRPLGISLDNFEPVDQQRCKELRDAMLKKEADSQQKQETIRTPTRERKASTPTLEKQSPIDLESGSELDQDPIEMKIDQILARDDSLESSSGTSLSMGNSKIKIIKTSADNVHKKLCRMSGDGSRSPDRSVAADTKKLVATRLSSSNGKSSLDSKSSLESKGSISVDSKGSFETESSSGSLGAAQRRGELIQKEQQSTWKAFPIESSGSSSIEENWAPPDQESYEKYDVTVQRGVDDFSSFKPALEKKESSPDEMKESDSSAQDDLSDFTTNFGYPAMTSGLGLSINPTDILGYGTSFALGRTLSRISERSTNSEKSSMEDDLSKGSTHSGSIRDESVVSTDHQTSFSSDPPSNTNLAYISDADRRTSAEMPDIPCDSATVDRLSDLYAGGGGGSSSSSGKQTGRFSVSHIDDGVERFKREHRPTMIDFSNAGGSQDSEDWPLPEIPYDHVPVAKVPLATDTRPIPKTFGWRHSMSMQSQDSENWPSPPDSGELDTPIVESVETFYLSEPQSATQVMVDSFTDHTPDDHDDSENRTLNEDDQLSKDLQRSPTISVVLPYEETAYMSSQTEYSSDPVTCLSSTFGSASCLRSTIDVCSARNTFTSSKDIHPSDKVIISQPTRTPQNQSPSSLDDDFGLADDVFGPGTVKIEISPDDTHLSDILTDKLSRGSNNSDTSLDDILSGSTFVDETVRRNLEPRLSSGSCKKCSHSSHSEEETSSLGTDLDGTVKMGLQQKKCTHSSHSEDTSIGLSISEWSTGTNTVRQYANLSGSDSLSAVSNHSTGAKSEKSNHTKSSVSSINKSTESLNEKSGSLSGSKNKFSCENASTEGAKYEVFSNSEISSTTTKSDDTTLTLTEMAQSITEWSTSSSKTLVAQVDYPDYGGEYKVDKKTLSIEYMPLKPPKVVKKQSPPNEEKEAKKVKKTSSNESPPEDRPQRVSYPPPRIVDMEAKPQFRKQVAESSVASKRKSLELMSQRYQSQDIASESENLPRTLAPVDEQPEGGGGIRSLLTREPSPFDKPLIKHHSYDDKTLSKSQIREYKSSKVKQSRSFHEHMISPGEFQKIDEEKLSSSTTTHNSETTSTDNSSPMPSRAGKLIQCVPHYSSSLSSDSPPIQQLQKPPRKSSIPRNATPKSPSSGNDTDSSVDFRQQQDPKLRTRGYRKRKQVPAKRTRLDRVPLEQQESSECSEGCFQEVDSGSSDMSRREYCEHEYIQYVEEEPEQGLPEEEEEEDVRYESYPGPSFSARFESLDMTEGNVDEMGFPKYDRLGHITKPMYRQQETPSPSSMPPIKPQRQRKRGLKREDSTAVASTSAESLTNRRRPDYITEGSQEMSFPEDIFYSSEYGGIEYAGFSTQIHVQRKVELPYPDFLSDQEEILDYPHIQLPTNQSGESEKSFDESEFDIRTVPPPMFLGESEELSDN